MKTKKLTLIVASMACIVTFGVFSATAQAPQPVSPSEDNHKAKQLIAQALEFEQTGQLRQAMATYHEILKLEPKDFAAINSIAGLYGHLGEAGEQITWAKKAIEAEPRYWQAYINLGNGYAVMAEKGKAITAFKKASEISPQSPFPFYSLGVLEENSDKFAEALVFYKKSIELEPRFEPGYFNAAAMHANLKQFDEAKRLLRKLLELNPYDGDAKAMLQHIESLTVKP